MLLKTASEKRFWTNMASFSKKKLKVILNLPPYLVLSIFLLNENEKKNEKKNEKRWKFDFSFNNEWS